ncbi:hypothetical protein CFP71_13340 [Amycolatopsis thailandensis]|uniref:Uncharacterized protein n=1 Tax=Amycolatopsis thailandensis TaxID=589330 RepID=A0A229SBV3_9PSEU|nr:hypothetical protein [Amycolatopsis thailandensis]OXM56407.1 hypothetical protein CFP71_13340 [Amycolatopsis thailandensis]
MGVQHTDRIAAGSAPIADPDDNTTDLRGRAEAREESGPIGYRSNVLIEPIVDRFKISVPALCTGDDRMTVWPRPTVQIDGANVLEAVRLDVRAWHVTYAEEDDPIGVTLPVVCRNQDAAAQLAAAFSQHQRQGYAAPNEPEELMKWCVWWVSENPAVDLVRDRTDE